jgi:hypothetical protein
VLEHLSNSLYLLLPSLHSLDSLYFQGKDLNIHSAATSATIINSQSTMDIKGTTSKIVACSGNSPCTASIGNTCSAASSSLGGVVCSLPACPTIVEGSNWNEWSASCAMSSRYEVTSGKTVKIKKSSSMVGELVIDRDGVENNHQIFFVFGTLEMEDVTLTGGHGGAVSSFCSLVLCILCDYSYVFFTNTSIRLIYSLYDRVFDDSFHFILILM